MLIKVRQTLIANGCGDGFDRQVGLPEKRPGVFNPNPDQVVLYGEPPLLLEGIAKLTRRDPDCPGDLLHGELLRISRSDHAEREVGHTFLAAQKLGIDPSDRTPTQGTLDLLLDLIGVERFLDVSGHPEVGGVDGRIMSAKRGYDDHRHGGSEPSDAAKHFDAMEVGEFEVEHHEIDRIPPEQTECRPTVFGEVEAVVVPQGEMKGLSNRGIVVYNKTAMRGVKCLGRSALEGHRGR